MLRAIADRLVYASIPVNVNSLNRNGKEFQEFKELQEFKEARVPKLTNNSSEAAEDENRPRLTSSGS
jgi:hypothetical protein